MKLKKSLGQHFLKNPILSEKISSSLQSTKDDIILEIGCGAGALTYYLINEKFKELHIIEIDDQWAANAQKNFVIKENIFLHHKSILEIDVPTLCHHTSLKIIGNIPYNITFEIINFIIKNHEYVQTAIIMMQEEVALKLHKKNGRDYGPISVLTQLYFDVTLHMQVGPQHFTPPPKVTSRVIELRKKECNIKDREKFYSFLHILFNHPRKTIKNNIIGTHLEKIITDEVLLQKRAQQFTPLALYDLFVDYQVQK